MGEFHGDEPEIEAEYRARMEAYEQEHADDWKYERGEECTGVFA